MNNAYSPFNGTQHHHNFVLSTENVMKYVSRDSRDEILNYKYKRFYKIYDHQMLKTRALKREKPKIVGSY